MKYKTVWETSQIDFDELTSEKNYAKHRGHMLKNKFSKDEDKSKKC